MKPAPTTALRAERGMALVVSLIIMLVLSIIIIEGAKQTALQQQMAGNYGQYQRAFQAAESGLRQGEAQAETLSKNLNVFQASGNGRYSPSATPNPFASNFWSAAAENSMSGTAIKFANGQDVQPRYTIQLKAVIGGGTTSAVRAVSNYGSQQATAPGAALFEITAYGPEQRGGGVVLRSYYQVALSYAPSWVTTSSPPGSTGGSNPGNSGNGGGNGNGGSGNNGNGNSGSGNSGNGHSGSGGGSSGGEGDD